jgi:hypothetical protein
MFISCTASAANGFKKWSAAHPAAKYAPESNKAASIIAPPASDTSSPHPESARSSRPMTDFKLSGVHIRRALRLRQTAEAAPLGGPLRARLLDLALQYDRMAVNSRHDPPDARQMRDA